MNHIYDTKALELSRQVMAIMYGPMPAGGSVQLQAKIQNLFIEAIQFAEQKVPAGYVLVSAEFIDTVNQALKEVGDRKSFPGHSHDIPGVWDSDNGEKANKTCAQCAMWSKLHDMLAAAPAVSDGWIPVSERMPEWKSDYRYMPLNLLLNGRTVVQGGFDDGRFWLDGVRISNVTAWQPLPAAPKGV